MFYFTLGAGHVYLVASVNTANRGGALPDGGADTVHGGVSTAQYQDVLAGKVDMGVIGQVEIVQVAGLTDQVFQRRNDTAVFLTRQAASTAL